MSNLREEVAGICHKSWSGWMVYMFSKCIEDEDMTLIIPNSLVSRWERQLNTPYSDLPEEEKVSDRVEADVYLNLIAGNESLKVVALSDYLSAHTVEDGVFNVDGDDYLVLTEEEARSKAFDYIENSLWAFDSQFLSGVTRIDKRAFASLTPLGESANEIVRSVVDKTCGIQYLVDRAIEADGLAHFLSTYDGEELELNNYLLAYRV